MKTFGQAVALAALGMALAAPAAAEVSVAAAERAAVAADRAGRSGVPLPGGPGRVFSGNPGAAPRPAAPATAIVRPAATAGAATPARPAAAPLPTGVRSGPAAMAARPDPAVTGRAAAGPSPVAGAAPLRPLATAAAAAPPPAYVEGRGGRVVATPSASPLRPGAGTGAVPAARTRQAMFVSPFASSTQREIAAELSAAGVDGSAATAEFYRARGFQPIWTEGRAAELQARLAEARYDGLDPSDYAVSPGLSGGAREVALTEAALLYARHAHAGRVPVGKVSGERSSRLDEAAFLASLSRGGVAATLEAVHPQHEGYQALRRELRELLGGRAAEPAPVAAVGAGPTLKLGMAGDRVALLRTRLGLGGGDAFDGDLDKAVKSFQSSHGLKPDGIVGRGTVSRLDGGSGGKAGGGSDADAIAANLERWRWLPSDLGGHYVFVDIPAYEVRVVSGGRETYRGRVIVGQPSTPTPIFTDEIEHIVVNPYWNVPNSIATNEMLGELRANPSRYFSRRGYEAVVKGKVVNPSSVKWSAEALKTVSIRQKPGDDNALGNIKFLFPNEHDVYLHDTPTRGLFERPTRALSHGCVRVDRPFEFADALLSDDAKLTAASLKGMVGGNQQWLNLSTKIPVHLAYFTREVGPDGRLVRHPDIYGYDARVLAALR